MNRQSKALVEQGKEVTALKLENHTSGDSYHSDEQYGDWYDRKHNSIDKMAEIVGTTSYYDILADWKINSTERIYLVYVEYGSGDSFGNSSGNLEYVSVFKTREKAEAAKKEIERGYDAYSYKERSYNKNEKPEGTAELKIVLENGAELLMEYAPWYGYFESLETVEIKELIAI